MAKNTMTFQAAGKVLLLVTLSIGCLRGLQTFFMSRTKTNVVRRLSLVQIQPEKETSALLPGRFKETHTTIRAVGGLIMSQHHFALFLTD